MRVVWARGKELGFDSSPCRQYIGIITRWLGKAIRKEQDHETSAHWSCHHASLHWYGCRRPAGSTDCDGRAASLQRLDRLLAGGRHARRDTRGKTTRLLDGI